MSKILASPVNPEISEDQQINLVLAKLQQGFLVKLTAIRGEVLEHKPVKNRIEAFLDLLGSSRLSQFDRHGYEWRINLIKACREAVAPGSSVTVAAIDRIIEVNLCVDFLDC